VTRQRVIESLAGKRALIVGDVMLDEYIHGQVHRISPDAPVAIVELAERERRLGGAANVAANVAALGGEPRLVGVVGKDEHGRALAEMLAVAGIRHGLVSDHGRPTTRKTRVLARSQQLLCVDEEWTVALSHHTADAVVAAAIDGDAPDVVLLSDYGKGVIGRDLAQRNITWAHRSGIPVVVDPKNVDFTIYRGVDYVTPDTNEAQLASGRVASAFEHAIAAGHALLEKTGGRGILVTRGEHGMVLVRSEGAVRTSALTHKVFDVTGAGDTVVATFALAIAAGADAVDAMVLSNYAASVVVTKVGAVTCSLRELAHFAGLASGTVGVGPDGQLGLHCIAGQEEARRMVVRWREDGRRVVFTNGCFDVLHAGHVALLEQARGRVDLVVGINSDDSTRRLKGRSRRMRPLADRARVIAGLAAVDIVVPFGAETPLDLVRALRPDVVVKGGDHTPRDVVGAKDVVAWAGEVVIVPLLARRSTTDIPARAANDGIACDTVKERVVVLRPSPRANEVVSLQTREQR